MSLGKIGQFILSSITLCFSFISTGSKQSNLFFLLSDIVNYLWRSGIFNPVRPKFRQWNIRHIVLHFKRDQFIRIKPDASITGTTLVYYREMIVNNITLNLVILLSIPFARNSINTTFITQR